MTWSTSVNACTLLFSTEPSGEGRLTAFQRKARYLLVSPSCTSLTVLQESLAPPLLDLERVSHIPNFIRGRP